MGTKQVCVYIHTTGRKTWDNADWSVRHGSQRCGGSESCDFISSKKRQKCITDSRVRLCRSVSVDVCCYVIGHACAVSPGGEGRILTNNVGMSVYCPHLPTPPSQPPLHPHSLSPFLPLSLEGTERAFYCSTSPPVFFFSKKAPKEPHQHSTYITSSLHPITCAYHTECMCACIPVCV